MPLLPSTISRRVAPGRPRRAATVLEVIITLPVLVILLLAIIEFGVLFANLQQLALASRVGAQEASQTANLDTAVLVPAEVIAVIERQLGGANMTACRIRLEHNDGGGQTQFEHPIVGACNCGPTTLLAAPPGGEYVRVTVCVDLTLVTPNLLDSFGFDIAGRMAEHTTVMRYER